MATVEELFKEFQKLPDWNRFPLPKCVYEKFNLPEPKAVSISDYFREYTGFEIVMGGEQGEVRPPAEGGIREMPTNQTSFLHLEDLHEEKEDSKEAIETKTQESESRNESNPH